MMPEEKNEQPAAVLTEDDFKSFSVIRIMRHENVQLDKGQWIIFYI